MSIQIHYPKGVYHDSGLGQAFRLAVMHGLCYLANDSDHERDLSHFYSFGYWTGRVSAFQQMSRTKTFKDFTAAVVAEIKRLEVEIDNENRRNG